MKPDDLNGISERVIGCVFDVSNALEVGFLEKVYENALAHELRKSGPVVAQQHPVTVIYDGVVLGNYTVDLLVEESVMAETSGLGRIRDALEAAQGAFSSRLRQFLSDWASLTQKPDCRSRPSRALQCHCELANGRRRPTRPG